MNIDKLMAKLCPMLKRNCVGLECAFCRIDHNEMQDYWKIDGEYLTYSPTGGDDIIVEVQELPHRCAIERI